MDVAPELARLALPDRLDGKRVLDVGCSDGFYSFTAEDRGATEVVGIDDLSSLMVEGRKSFAIAKALRGSAAEFRDRSIYDLDPATDGTFDAGWFLNVLHLERHLIWVSQPGRVIKPGGLLVMKPTFIGRSGVAFAARWRWAGRDAAGFNVGRRPRLWFYPHSELSNDPTNWGPQRGLCRCHAGRGRVRRHRNLGVHGDRHHLHAAP
ncbi:MAG: methyltransferase domain-containing protein [Candidatus Microthrix sp.]|uniref:class I SAM-dependent methyltransferase n=1 Tax=Candidatus Neomicrothrix sp. TaxID=2719034 RepID=UPI0025BC27B1|nr:class I SAM-dependent methyltransferase [Candidatus Microthrix sp.]MBL0204694.1 methyltransferase domain-containing protein [Candidatus Microthrix sp.]